MLPAVSTFYVKKSLGNAIDLLQQYENTEMCLIYYILVAAYDSLNWYGIRIGSYRSNLSFFLWLRCECKTV